MALSKTLTSPMCDNETETRKIFLEVHIVANDQRLIFLSKVVIPHHE